MAFRTMAGEGGTVMRTLLVAALGLMPLLAWAEPMPHTQSVEDLQVVSAAVGEQPTISVANPNDPQGARSVTPYKLSPDLDPTLVWLEIRNRGASAVDVPLNRVRLVFPNALNSRSAMSMSDLKAPWGRFLSYAVAPPEGVPRFFDQEVANRAEQFLANKTFVGGTIPPGGVRSGYVAFARTAAVTPAVILEFELQRGEQSRRVTAPVAGTP
jgi:hypothetical protein